ncbi:MAG TPA: alanine racemase [Clostridiales bacterium]|nr:alanine racemase [Clostridiales bacterium]
MEILISRSAVENNIELIRKIIGEEVRISSVVKANAYGHGIEAYVPVVKKCGIDHFSVFSYNEAVQVYNIVKSSADIMIMGWIGPSQMKDAVDKGIEFYVFNLERLTDALKAAKTLKKRAKIHLEVETGMNRTGFSKKEFKEALQIISRNSKHFTIKGLCSHLAGPESIANHVRVKNQIKTFGTFKAELEKTGHASEYCHLACSAAAVCYPSSRHNLVRIGIMQYGFWSSREVFLRYLHNKTGFNNPLKRVITWKSEIMSVKTVKTGKFISYGTTYLASQDMRTAIVPVGYSFGYSRSLSNRGRVLINGVRCSVIGLVNMNMITVDITRAGDVKPGDEVILIGDQNDMTISVDSFSEITQQINYEILSRLSRDIPRITEK